MSEDPESDTEAHRQDAEEERRRQRTDKQDPTTQPSSSQSGGESTSNRDDEGDSVEPLLDYTPGELIIPDVTLDDGQEVKSIQPTTVIPSVEQTNRDLTVPQLSIQEIDIEPTSVNIEIDTPDITREGKDWQIPLFQRGSASTVQFRPSSFDKKIREPRNRHRQQLTVPLYRRVSTPQIRFMSDLTVELHEGIRRRLERLESNQADEAERQEPAETQEEEMDDLGESDVTTSTAEGTTATGGGGHSGKSGEEVPTFEDIIFNGAGGASTTPDGTTIVLFDEAEDNSYIGSFLSLCRRIYREANGGHPDFQTINELDEINKREIEKWLDADKKVICIDLDDRERRIDEAKLREKLEATIGEFGFIVFKATDPELVEEYRDTLDEIRIESPHPPLNVVEVSPTQLGFECERRITELCWGNLNLPSAGVKRDEPEIERLIGSGVFDDLFNHAATEFDNYLDDIKSEERGLFKHFTAENDEGDESSLHYDIKVYVVRYLVQRLRERGADIDGFQDIGQWIETESERGGVIPDVFLSGQREAYEIETMFGGGQEPTKKIDRTIKKYDEHDVDVDTIHIILENFTFLRHLDELSNIQHHYAYRKNEDSTPTVDFKTLDLQHEGFLSLRTVIEEMKDLKQ